MSQAAPPKADPQQTHVAVQWQHASPLICCRFDPKGVYLFGTAEDRTVQRWKLADGAKVGYPAQESWIQTIGFSPDGATLYTGGCDGRLIWWPASADKPEPIRKIDAHMGWLRQLAVSPDGKLITTVGNDRLVRIWDSATGNKVAELAGHESCIYTTLFHPSGQALLSGDLKGQIKHWELPTGKLLGAFDATPLYSYNGGQGVDYGGVRSLAFSKDGKFLIASGLHNASNPLGAVNDPIVLLFDAQTRAKVRAHTAGDLKGVAWRAVFHPDGYIVTGVGGSGGGLLVFWKTDADKEFFKFGLPNTARDLDLHPDGIQVATAHHDRHVRISKLIAKPA